MTAPAPVSAENRPGPNASRCSAFDQDSFIPETVWLREAAEIRLLPLREDCHFTLHGEFRRHPKMGRRSGWPRAECRIDGRRVAVLTATREGPFAFRFPVPGGKSDYGPVLRLRVRSHFGNDLLAELTRTLERVPWLSPIGRKLRHRHLNRHRQLRFTRLADESGETVVDFSQPGLALSIGFIRRHARLGLNIAGYLAAECGIGEMARCTIKGADSAGLPSALIQLKLPCPHRHSDTAYLARAGEKAPHPVNVIHVDIRDSVLIDAHHPGLRRGRYNIGFWAWELSEFPDAWAACALPFDEVWCLSEFARAACAPRLPMPVLAMPLTISFPRPTEPAAALRARFGLPADRFLFLFAYDLRSVAARKNPQAVVAAFRASGLAERGAALVIKVLNGGTYPDDLAALRAAVADLPGALLLTEALSRSDVYALQAACDCFVSLHHSEGFGLSVAESMFQGKPVISTDWSATAEFVTAENGCPVRARLVALEQDHGPYKKGQIWAEPDIEHAAWHMRRIAGDAALAAKLGAAGRASIEAKFSPAAIGACIRRRLETIARF